jgi:hypothetical protein
VLPLFEHRIGTAAIGLHLSALRREAVLLNVRDSAGNEQSGRFSRMPNLVSLSSIPAGISSSELADGY